MIHNSRSTLLLKLFALSMLLSALNPQPSTVLAQGSLTPPGAPSATMRTLTQIEPRTPIATAPFTITQPGSYYLSANLTAVSNAIVINTNGVTLDLRGFTISSSATNAATGGTAILINGGLSDLTICNGHIRGGVSRGGAVFFGPGFFNGIAYIGVAPFNTRVSGVSAARIFNNGIYLGLGGTNLGSTVVESCTVRTAGGNGIVASTIKDSAATDCWVHAIASLGTVMNCHGQSIGVGYGIYAYDAQNSYGDAGASDGLRAETVLNCYGVSAGATGLFAGNAQNCYGFSYASSAFGLRALVAHNSRGYNAFGGTGLYGELVATACYGHSVSGTGLSAHIANSCYGATTSGAAQAITHKYNMP